MKKGKSTRALELAGKITLADPRIKKLAKDIEKLRVRTARNFVLIGRKLLQAKKLLKHGDWLIWLEHEAGRGSPAFRPGRGQGRASPPRPAGKTVKAP